MEEDGPQISKNQKYFDIYFGYEFHYFWSELKHGESREGHKLSFQVTESIKSIFKFKTLEINPSSTDYTLYLVVDGESYTLEELGSGISRILISFVNVAVANPIFILIDEPELNLHPSLQLDFLTSLASFSSTGIVFGTHSIGLARSSSERIYSVFKGTKKKLLFLILKPPTAFQSCWEN